MSHYPIRAGVFKIPPSVLLALVGDIPGVGDLPWAIVIDTMTRHIEKARHELTRTVECFDGRQ